MYFQTLLVTLGMLILITLVGLRVCDLLPVRIRPIGRLYFSPLFGLAVFILIATLHGWMAPFHQWICLSTAFPLLLLSFSLEKKKQDLIPHFLLLFLFSLLASSTVFFPILRFEAYNSFNDTFTYIVHGQWLQDHPFSEPAVSSGFFPALTQVTLYQGAGHRMGGSFLLGWVQGAFGMEWSYFTYPSVIVLPLIAGSLAVGGTVKLIIRGRRIISFLTAASMATFFNGFAYGAMDGFFPQTFGLAFAIGSITLLGTLLIEFHRKKNSIKKMFINTIPLSLMVAGLAFSYNDLLPFIAAGGFISFTLFILYKKAEMKKTLMFIAVIFIQATIFINFEFIRIIKNFIDTLLGVGSGAATIGWPVPWKPIEFLAHGFGFKSPIGSGWLFGNSFFTYLIFILLLFSIIYHLYANNRNKTSLTLQIHFFVVLVFIIGFFYFRYHVPPPRPTETGYTFLQFKLSKWASPFCFVLMGTTIAYFCKTFQRTSRILHIFFIFTILIAVIGNYKFSKHLTNHFLDETGFRQSAFSSFLNIRDLVENINPDEAIYMNLGAAHHKLRQMVAYSLFDRKLSGDYSDDGYIHGKLPPEQRSMSFKSGQWVIDYLPPEGKKGPSLPRVGNLVLRKAPEFLFKLVSVLGGHGRESDKQNWWYWTNRSLEFNYKTHGTLEKVQFKMVYMPATENRELKIVFKNQNATEQKIKMNGGWNEYISPVFNLKGPDIKIRFTSEEDPIRISKTDPRLMSFLISNLKLIPVEN
jgi:hypothetical protein